MSCRFILHVKLLAALLALMTSIDCSLFQEERPVWHTIDCNVLPNDYKATKVEEDKVESKQILMVTGDKEYPSSYQTEE